MKLTFYALDTEAGEPVLKIEECNAVKENGVLHPKEGCFPNGVRMFLLESDLNRLAGVNYKPVVVMEKPDLALAKQMLLDFVNQRIDHYKALASTWERKRKVVEQIENIQSD